MTYEELGRIIGKSKQTIHNWMLKDFPRIAEKMSKDGMVALGGDLPKGEVMSEQDLILEAIHDLAKQLRPALDAVGPQRRKEALDYLGPLLRSLDPLALSAVLAEDDGDF